MKKYMLAIFMAAFTSILAGLPAAAASTTVEALPSAARVLVDGKEIQFQAYEIDGYNYFKVRDLAVVFSGKRQQFVPQSSGESYGGYGFGNGVYLRKSFGEYEKYQPIGDELKTGDGMAKVAVEVYAYACVDSTMQKQGIMSDSLVQRMSAYSIEDYTYIKLRDLAKIYDFGVRWNAVAGCIEIDTEIPYILSEWGPPVRTTEKAQAGRAYESERMVFINEMPVMSYVVDVDGQGKNEDLIYIVAEDLENYSFDVSWDEASKTLSLAWRDGKLFGMLDGETINDMRNGEPLCPVYMDNIRVLLDGRAVGAYSLDGRLLIPLAELYPYGIFSYGLDPDHSENPIADRINLDLLKMELSREFEGIDRESIQSATLENYYERPGQLRSFENLNTGLFPWGIVYYQEDSGGLMSGMVSFELDCNEYDPYYYKFLGCFSDNKMNGQGLYYKRFYDGPAMYGAAESNAYERGVYQDGRLYDGVVYKSANVHGSYGSRVEGAMVDGYQRRSIVESRPETNYRFGYRVLCEGEVQNGEFCGYYRAYDNDGKLVFEGQYSDYLSQQAE